ncbi:MAG: protein kinase, partial [Bryobacteraceae bacterium]
MSNIRRQDPERWRLLESLYHGAIQRDPAAREAYLRAESGGDADLCREVEELLAHQAPSDQFMGSPAIDMVARRDMAMLASQPEFRLTTGACLGPYEIEQPLGRGGAGEVYRALDTRLGRVVALKVLISGSLEQGVRLEREARSISSLNHPYICALYDIGRETDLDYLVMEYVDGPTLAARLREGRLPTADLLRIAKEVAEALDCAHRQGIVHRDLKPGNIMLAPRGAKLVDFGLARRREQNDAAVANPLVAGMASVTVSGMVAGTPQYMAPEHIAGARVDARTDIFAFGAVLFELAYGCKAFGGDNPMEVMESIRSGEVQPVSRREFAAPAALDRVIRKCLQKAPEQRYQSAAEVLRDLQRIERQARHRIPLDWRTVLAGWAILAVGAVAVARLRPTPPLAAQILYSFKGKDGDGARCWRSGLTMDTAGAIYGFTYDGGIGQHGIAYKLVPPVAGRGTGWHEEVLYRFHGPDGAKPLGSPVFGADGSLYGASSAGGRENHGVIFRLTASRQPGDSWQEIVVHHFTPSSGDGGAPTGTPVFA